jgi:hypothetical protein
MTICGVGAWERVGVARCETSAGSLTFFTRLVVHIVSELFSFPFLSIVASVHPVTTTGTTNSHMRVIRRVAGEICQVETCGEYAKAAGSEGHHETQLSFTLSAEYTN